MASSATASALAQSVAGVFQGIAPPVEPSSLIIAPPTPVRSPNGEFQIVRAPLRYDAALPPTTGPNAQHQVQNMVVDKVAFAIGDPVLMPQFTISDREAMNLTSANPDLDIMASFSEALYQYVYTDHLFRTVTAVGASSISTYGTPLDVTALATNLHGYFSTLIRNFMISRGYRPTHLVMNAPAVDALDQFNSVSDTSAIAGANSSIVTARLGSNPVGAFARWMLANFGVEVVRDETIYTTAANADAWGLGGTSAYLIRSAGGNSPSAFKSLYVESTEALAVQSDSEATSSAGMFRFSVRRVAAPAQPGWSITADSQFLCKEFDPKLGLIVTLQNVPAI